MSETTQVIVIGSGFGGSVSASRIAEAGFKVKLIERGPWRDSVPVRSMGVQERAPYPSGWRYYTALVRTLRNGKLPGGKVTLNKRGLFEIHIGKGLNVVCSSSVGGGSQVYNGINVRAALDDYWDGVCDGLSTGIMDTHYDNVIKRMGSSTPKSEHIPNSVSERFKGSDFIASDASVDKIQLGYLFPKKPGSPQEVVTEDGVTRREFTYGADANLGSPLGGKTTLDFAFLARAMKHGLDVLDLREALSIRPVEGGMPARYKVTVENHHTGAFEAHYADHVIVAAGTLNTLHLLLRSRDAKGGLHGMAKLGHRFGGNGDFFGYWDLDDTSRDLTKGLAVHGWIRAKDEAAGLGGNRRWPTIVGIPLPNPDNLPLPGWLKRKFRHGQVLGGMGPDAQDGVVTLEKGRLKIDYKPENSDIFEDITDAMDMVSEKTRKRLYYLQRPTTVHPTGGACVGANIREGVVDGNGEVFDHAGLYVADAAALPKPPGTAPSMTIAAWADHVAEQLIEKLETEAGSRRVAVGRPKRKAKAR